MWEILAIDPEKKDLLRERLSEGWEPFSVTVAFPVSYMEKYLVWLRRQTAESTTPKVQPNGN